ncbi:MAG TPA: hypothetical protein VH414_04710 [Lichenihabitans sp.]|nr:hypothetical protein [Lichenihabitans sp.]
MSTFFEDNKPLAFISIFVALLALFVILLVLRRMLFGRRLKASGGARTRQPRLGFVDAVDLDRHRQLVLVRRDNVEHLVMIGGPNDLLIETTIVRAQSVAPMSGGRDKDVAMAQATPMPQPPASPPGMGQPSMPPLVAPPVSAAGPVQGAPPVAAPVPPGSVTAPPPLAAPTDRPQPRPAPAAPPPRPAAFSGPATGSRSDDQAGAGPSLEGEGAATRPGQAPAASRPAPSPPPARPGGLPPRPVPAATPARPAPPPRPGLPPRPSLASTLPPRPLRPAGLQSVPRQEAPPAVEPPSAPDANSAAASRPEPDQAGAVAQGSPPKNLETLESLEEEMAKLLGRPAPRRDG